MQQTEPNQRTTHADPISESTRIRLISTLFLAHGSLIAANVASFTLMPIIATQMMGESMAGVPPTLSMVGRAIGGYPMGWLMDRMGRRLGLSVGYLVAVLGSALATFAVGWESFIGFCIGMGLLGVGRATSEQARFVAAEITQPARRAKIIGIIVAAGIAGGVGGPFLVAPAEDLLLSLGWPYGSGSFILSALLSLISLLLILMFLYPEPLKVSLSMQSREQSTANKLRTNDKTTRNFWEIMREPPVVLAMASLIIGQLVMVWLMIIMSVHMTNNAHSLAAIASVIAYHNAGMYAFSWMVGWVVDKMGHVATIIAGAVILAMSTIMSPLSAGFPNLAAAMFLVGLGWSFTFVAGSSLLSNSLDAGERGQIQGISESLVSIAGGAGSLGTGVFYAIGGMTLVSVFGLVISIFLFLAVSWYRLRPQPAIASS